MSYQHSNQSNSRQQQQQQQRQQQQPRYSPLAMIPGSHQQQHESNHTRIITYNNNNNNNSNHRPTSSLHVIQRGGGERDESLDENLLPPSSSSYVPSQITTRARTILRTIASSKKARGRAILLLVAFLYGTLNVTLRAVYASEGPPAASVLSLVRQVLSIASFVPIFMASSSSSPSSSLAGTEEGEEERQEQQQQIDGIGVRPMWMSAMELAFWNFGAQGLINAGLLFSPAARASFLTQTSVVMTPLLSALAGETIKSSVWGGCVLALFGLFLISTSSASSSTSSDAMADAAAEAVAAASATTSTFNQGDAMILLGALSWSMYIFRTSKLAKSYSELTLQFTKTWLLALMYLGWFFVTASSALASAGTPFPSPGWAQSLLPLWSGWNSPVVWLLLAYSAVGPGAVADLLQQRGQRETSASESNIILCMESVFATICAFAILGEVSSLKEMVGGLLIVVAAVLASK
eukprot:CAMPEP_0196160394 /NCGR_PEP_ID=MMETSP0910-20130528/46806_1 /TAXON_ID=49265 /ORGANISM="Thalassiosira rotula, Strain GSO102" /LENGTH=464 /DNA_ID=CAMNT_0041425325 /DNA_START=241 /DNA_END=1635 /DNA_ORIENTATION=+